MVSTTLLYAHRRILGTKQVRETFIEGTRVAKEKPRHVSDSRLVRLADRGRAAIATLGGSAHSVALARNGDSSAAQAGAASGIVSVTSDSSSYAPSTWSRPR
jgi:hypothetical protein